MTDTAPTPSPRVAAARAKARAYKAQRSNIDATVRSVLATQDADTTVEKLVTQVSQLHPELGEWTIISTIYEDLRGPDLEVDAAGTVRLNADAFITLD